MRNTESLVRRDLYDTLCRAESTRLTGDEAWGLFLDLKRLKYLEEENEKLRRICQKINAMSDEVHSVVGFGHDL